MSDYLKYLPFVLIALLTLLQVFVRVSARRARGISLEGMLEPQWLEKERAVIYFSSAFCGPCQAMAPMIDRLANDTGNLLKLDAIAEGDLASQLGARGAPAFVEIARGRVVKVHLGSLTEARLRQML